MSKPTAHSEYGKLRSILLKRPRDGFISDEVIAEQWQSHGYLAPPKFEQSTIDFELLEDLISRTGTAFHYLKDSRDVTIDSVYCRDAAIATDFGMILCRMGKGHRKNEPNEVRKYFEKTGIDILGEIKAPGTLEGGDVAWLDQNTLAVGHTYRTNTAGINQLKTMLEPRQITILNVELPHYKGESDVFHLMSILSPVDKKKAVVYSPLMPIYFRNELLDRGFELIEVPDQEFESMGCNVLAISPGECIMAHGNSITKSRLETSGCTVHEYDGTEISFKGSGGPTCLTRPLLREA